MPFFMKKLVLPVLLCFIWLSNSQSIFLNNPLIQLALPSVGEGFHDSLNIIGMANEGASAKIYIFDKFGKPIKQIRTVVEALDSACFGSPFTSSDADLEWNTKMTIPKKSLEGVMA